MKQELLLNIIPFTSPVKEIILPFYISKQANYYGLYLDEEVLALSGDKVTPLELIEDKWIYTDFGTPQKDAIVVTINVEQDPIIALLQTFFIQTFPPLSGVLISGSSPT